MQTHTPGIVASLGNGPNLVLLHGFGLNETIWEAVIPLITPHYRVHVIGWPGLSAQVPYVPLDSMAAAADWLHEVLRSALTGPVYLAGHSMGGYIALSYLARYPDHVKGLLLVHSHIFQDSEEKRRERERVARFVTTHGTGKWLKDAIPPLFGSAYKKNNPQAVARWIDALAYLPEEAVAGYLSAIASREDHSHTIREAAFPIGVIAGKEDRHAPMDIQYAQLGIAPSPTLYYLSASAHMGMVEEPQKTAEAIIDYHDWCTMMTPHFLEQD